jgi:hypothetical protein
MTKERPPQVDPPPAEPALASASGHETTTFGSPSEDAEPETPRPKKKIDPWRFGFHTVPPGMQATLLASPLPETPKDRLYRSPGPLPDESGESAAPLATDELHVPKRDLRRPIALTALALLLLAAALVVYRFASGGEAVKPAPSSATRRPVAPAPLESSAEGVTVRNGGTAVPAALQPTTSSSVVAPRVKAPGKPEGTIRKPRETKPHSNLPAQPAPERAAAPDPRSILVIPAEN